MEFGNAADGNSVTTDQRAQKWVCDMKSPLSLGLPTASDKEIGYHCSHLWKTVWWFLKKLKIQLLYDPAIPFLGIYPDKSIIQEDKCMLVFTAALFTIAKT